MVLKVEKKYRILTDCDIQLLRFIEAMVMTIEIGLFRTQIIELK